jgi:hypothetical protein
MRVWQQGLLTYRRDHGVWPPDWNVWGQSPLPAAMHPYIEPGVANVRNPLGGWYHYVTSVAPRHGPVVPWTINVDPSVWTMIDTAMDDGNTSTGRVNFYDNGPSTNRGVFQTLF